MISFSLPLISQLCVLLIPIVQAFPHNLRLPCTPTLFSSIQTYKAVGTTMQAA